MTTVRPAKAIILRFLLLAHLWVGGVLSVPLVVLGLTGSFLVYADDIEHWLAPTPPRAVAVGEWRSPGEIAAAARTAATDATMAPSVVRLPAEIGEPALVRLAARGGGGRGGPQAAPPAGPPNAANSLSVLVDPVSLEILGQPTPPPQWMRVIHNLHGNLLITGRDGRVTVGWMGLAMLLLGLSGLVLWWPRRSKWRAAFVVKKGARGVRLHRDLHGAAGIWIWIVFMVVSFSGVYLAFPQQATAVIGTVFPGRDLRSAMAGIKAEPVRGATPMGIDDAVQLALGAVADARIGTVFLPNRPDQPLRVSLLPEGHRPGAPAITVFVDPWQRRVLEVQDPRSYTTGETIGAWQRGLHYGQGLGEIYRLLVFLSGLVIPLFAVTGLSMWWLKRRARRVGAERRAATPALAFESQTQSGQ